MPINHPAEPIGPAVKTRTQPDAARHPPARALSPIRGDEHVVEAHPPTTKER
jgi:hypothetical protein